MHSSFSLATNACALDGTMLAHTVPHWLRVFGDRVAEVVVVVDREVPSGRIATLHRDAAQLVPLDDSLNQLVRHDTRVRVVELQQLELLPIQEKWFGSARPVRCQAGTPVVAFVTAIESAHQDLVLRCDCDMLFREDGWLAQGDVELANHCNLYEPPRLDQTAKTDVSSRAFMVRKSVFRGRLPLRNLRLDPLRILHRTLHGRPTWIALEQMLQRAVQTRELAHRIGSDTRLGYSLHALRRSFANEHWFEQVVRAVEFDDLPLEQRGHWDLHPELWPVLH